MVSEDFPILKTFGSTVQELGGHAKEVHGLAAGRVFLSRRRVDGILLDAHVQPALDFIETVRQSKENQSSPIIVCGNAPMASRLAGKPGANLFLHKPFSTEEIVGKLMAAASIMAVERRKYARYPLATEILISGDYGLQRGFTMNISETGMGIRAAQKFVVGSRFEFVICLPSEREIRGSVEVVWCNDAGHAGVKFISLTSDNWRPRSGWLLPELQLSGEV